jgi:putative FmdB family regulatory protein
VPTYQYACTACGHQLEAVQSFSDDPLTECPACAGRLRKLFSSVGIVFKGSGFYRNDSRAESKAGAAKEPVGATANGSGSDGAAKSGSGKSESGKSESGKSESGKSESGKTGNGKSESGKSDGGSTGGGKSGGAKAETKVTSPAA